MPRIAWSHTPSHSTVNRPANNRPGLAGLLPFSPPRLPASLDFVTYIPKDEGDVGGVEAIVRAAAAALGPGARLSETCEVLSYRNNFNK